MRSAGVKILLRALKRHPVYTLINIVGLAVGMASFILISLFVREELRFDRFHEHADRIVRVTSHYTDETGTRSFARTYPAIAPALLSDFPDVSEATRLQHWEAPMRSGERQFNEQELFVVDPSFFRVFSFPLVRGDAAHALESKNSVVVTRSAARRYFGDDDPMGRELVMADTLHLQVTGLVEDPPPYSHIQFSMLLPMQIVRDRWARRGNDIDATWTAGTFYTYLLLTSAEARDALQPRLSAFLDRHTDNRDESGVTFRLELQRLTDIHLKSHLRQEMGPNGSETYVAAFFLIAILVLLISCVNFINLATARASKRMREVGVRKALGAPRLGIARQFLGEAFLMTFVALFLSILIVDCLLPWFNELAGSSISPASEAQPWHMVSLLALTIAVGFLAGGYPAIVLSSFRPSHVLRSAASGTTRGVVPGVRRSLVATQFFLSIGIMACTAIAWQQTVYMRSAPPGFDTHVLVLPYYWDSSVTAQLPTLKHELMRLSDVQNVTASGDVPGRMSTSMSYWIEGMGDEERGGTNALIV
ncbi:MAG: ABC transporter permease, partial [Rhodothermales bacterium]